MHHELLTPEEFAKKLRIGRSTLFEWLRKGILKPGVHYFKQGRIVRFLWTDAVVASLVEATRQQTPTNGNAIQRSPHKSKPGLNWEY